MKITLLAAALVAATFGAILFYPSTDAKHAGNPPPTDPLVLPQDKPKVDVVFVLDTTGSMSGLIQTAQEKIWSIATTMASAQPTPDIRIGLVGYRDRGDAYVTRVVDLQADLDSVYAELMDFRADGGGDTPESVNEALYDAVHRMSWSQDEMAYRAVFLVGDAPPHMDYQDDVRYPEIVADAGARGIVVNTVQCGNIPATAAPWRRIASLGGGRYFQVEQAGGAVALATPFDDELAALSARLDGTRLYYGSREEKAAMQRKTEATAKLHELASVGARARRGAFNASAAGAANFTGENELVSDVTSGRVDLAAIAPDALPESLQPMAPAEQEEAILQLADERAELREQVAQLSRQREEYLAQQVEEAGGAKDSLDQKIYDAVREQASEAGLVYAGGPDY